MSIEPEELSEGVMDEAESLEASLTSPARLSAYLRRGGVIVPILTTVIAFLVAGVVVLLTGHDPLSTYSAIFKGTGLNWLFPWVSGAERATAALALQQTLIQTTTLILVGLAVAFAFRAGLFNIGGQGQYTLGLIVAVWVGSSFNSMPAVLHIILAIALAALAGALWAGIAGALKATVGVHEVISTIMLNWIAILAGVYLFQLGGPLQDPTQSSVPVSKTIAASAKLPVFWGSAQLQGLDIGIFIALAAVVVFWILINRTRLGYEVRAVGFNPDAASYAGMNVGRTTSASCSSAARSPGWRRRWTSSAGSSACSPTTSRPRRSGSSASPWRCWDATRRAGSSRPRCCSAPCSPAHRSATSIPRCSTPNWRSTSRT